MIFSCQIQLCFKRDDCQAITVCALIFVHLSNIPFIAPEMRSKTNRNNRPRPNRRNRSRHLSGRWSWYGSSFHEPSGHHSVVYSHNHDYRNGQHNNVRLNECHYEGRENASRFPNTGHDITRKRSPDSRRLGRRGRGGQSPRGTTNFCYYWEKWGAKLIMNTTSLAETSSIKLLKKVNRAQRDTPEKPSRQINFDISSPELTIMDDYLGRLGSHCSNVLWRRIF